MKKSGFAYAFACVCVSLSSILVSGSPRDAQSVDILRPSEPHNFNHYSSYGKHQPQRLPADPSQEEIQRYVSEFLQTPEIKNHLKQLKKSKKSIDEDVNVDPFEDFTNDKESIEEDTPMIVKKKETKVEEEEEESLLKKFNDNVEIESENDNEEEEDDKEIKKAKEKFAKELAAEEEAASKNQMFIEEINPKTQEKIVVYLPYPKKELPKDGKNYPLPGTNQYEVADYDNSFYLKNVMYRRFNPLTNSLDGASGAFIHGVKGLVHTVRHPIDTAKDVAYAATHPHVVLPALAKKIKDNTREEGISNTLGATGFEVASLFTPVGIGKTAGKLGSLAGRQLGAKAGSAGRFYGGVGVAAETTGQALDVIGQVSDIRQFGTDAHAYQRKKEFLQFQEKMRSKEFHKRKHDNFYRHHNRRFSRRPRYDIYYRRMNAENPQYRKTFY